MHTLVRTIAGLAAAHLYIGGAAAQAQQPVTAGELVVEPPTLISLGFEWYIEGDANRNAAVAVAYRQNGESAWHESLPLMRVQNEHTFYTDTLWYVAPNMFAGSVFELKENTEYDVRFKLTDPDGVDRRSRAHREGPHACRAAGRDRRAHVSRLSVRLQRPAAGARVQRLARRLLQELARRRLEPSVAATRGARRHDPRARGRVQGFRPLQLQPRDRLSQHDVLRHAVGRHVLSDAARHGRQTDRDQGRRRRRGHLRRRRQQRAVQRDGRRLHVLRRPHVSQYEHRDRSRTEEDRRCRGPHRQALEVRERRRGRCTATGRARATSTSPTT